MDRLYYNVWRMFVSMMLNSSLTDEDGKSLLAWDAYIALGLSDFFTAAADMMLVGFDGSIYSVMTLMR